MNFPKNPASLSISEIWLTNYKNNFSINLLPQFVGMDLYMSIFNTCIKAELMLSDTIGLHVNFPLVGEEYVTVKFSTPINSGIKELDFRLTKTPDIIPNKDGRSSTYYLELHTFEYITNFKKRISRAYNEPISEIVKKILTNDLKTTKTIEVEETKGNQYVLIPNMYPFEAIKWLTKRAVSNDQNHVNYVFYESLDGFEFKTIQNLIGFTGDGFEQIPTYYYMTQITNLNKELEPWSVIKLTQNKRFDTIEKLNMGFYENEYFEIDPMNKQWNIERTKLESTPKKTISSGQLNTPEFITEMQSTDPKEESSSRVRYTVWSQDPQVSKPFFREKFGEGSQLFTAFSQISYTLLVQGNSNLDIGDMITLKIPEFHGFNNVDEDKYVQGNYLITDLKHQISMDGKFTTMMTVHKDSYSRPIEGTEYNRTQYGKIPTKVYKP